MKKDLIVDGGPSVPNYFLSLNEICEMEGNEVPLIGFEIEKSSHIDDLTWFYDEGEEDDFISDSFLNEGLFFKNDGSLIPSDQSGEYYGLETVTSPFCLYGNKLSSLLNDKNSLLRNIIQAKNTHPKRCGGHIHFSIFRKDLFVKWANENPDMREILSYAKENDLSSIVKRMWNYLHEEDDFASMNVFDDSSRLMYLNSLLGYGFHMSCVNPYTYLGKIIKFLPLLHAMYPSRAKGGYSAAVNSTRRVYNIGRNKSYSISICSNKMTIEFRIFSALDSISQAKFRVNLIKHMYENMGYDVWSVIYDMLNPDSKLNSTLRMINRYKNEENYEKLVERFLNQVKNFFMEDNLLMDMIRERTAELSISI